MTSYDTSPIYGKIGVLAFTKITQSDRSTSLVPAEMQKRVVEVKDYVRELIRK